MFKVVFKITSDGINVKEYWCKTKAEADYLASLKPYNTYIVENDAGPFDVLE